MLRLFAPIVDSVSIRFYPVARVTFQLQVKPRSRSDYTFRFIFQMENSECLIVPCNFNIDHPQLILVARKHKHKLSFSHHFLTLLSFFQFFNQVVQHILLEEQVLRNVQVQDQGRIQMRKLLPHVRKALHLRIVINYLHDW